MKYKYLLLLTIIIFTSCTNNRQVVTYKRDIKQPKIILNHKNIKKISIKQINLENNNTIIKKINKKIVIKQNSTIAIIYSSHNIGKYAIEAVNTAIGYALYTKEKTNLKVFDIKDESSSSIQNILNNLYDNNISKVICFITPKNIQNLYKYDKLDNFNIFLPLNNITQVTKTSLTHKNIIFGAISYTNQFKVLLQYSNSHIVEIYDNSSLGQILHNTLISLDNNITSIRLNNKNPNYYRLFKDNKTIKNSSLILNTSIVKSSILLSQLNVHNIHTKQILSTSVNFLPLLFVLTQTDDRKNLIIANSLKPLSTKLEEISLLLDNDIAYNWVNFATIIAIDYLQYNNNRLFKDVKIKNNQVQYNIKLYKADRYKFNSIMP